MPGNLVILLWLCGAAYYRGVAWLAAFNGGIRLSAYLNRRKPNGDVTWRLVFDSGWRGGVAYSARQTCDVAVTNDVLWHSAAASILW